MEDEFNLDLDDTQETINNNNRTKQRTQDLLEKNKTALKERDDATQAKAEAEAREQAAIKERDFFKDFSSSTSKYPGAHEYQDTIKEKVMAGYSVEDATIAVLAKEGKLQTFTAPEAKDSPAGGSATNAMKGEGEKTIGELTREEKRARLEKELV